LVHRLVATLARHGVSAAAQKKKKAQNEEKKSLSSNSETEHRPRTKLDRLWRYLSGETPTRLQSPFLCVDVRLYVRNQQKNSDGNVRANFLFVFLLRTEFRAALCEKFLRVKGDKTAQKFKQKLSALGA
jgi:hypothetical protein|tara:strand:- start:3767 stop:4153 length:387 start_codon:yes stop_codon:yes gene_type:complete